MDLAYFRSSTVLFISAIFGYDIWLKLGRIILAHTNIIYRDASYTYGASNVAGQNMR